MVWVVLKRGLRPFITCATLHELETYAHNVIVGPFGQVAQFVSKSFTFLSIFLGGRNMTREKVKKNLRKQFRLCQMDETIWLPQNNSIQVYDKTGELNRTIDCDHNVTVVRQACNGHLMLGGDHGLFYRTEKELPSLPITEGRVLIFLAVAF